MPIFIAIVLYGELKRDKKKLTVGFCSNAGKKQLFRSVVVRWMTSYDAATDNCTAPAAAAAAV